MASSAPARAVAGRSSSTVTGSPALQPSLSRGMRMMPSARLRLVMVPAPRGRGTATTVSPTQPSLTRNRSSMPGREGRGLQGTAVIFCRSLMARFCHRASRGRTNSSMDMPAETGYPGTPTTGLPLTTASTVGLPGMTEMPCVTTVPICPSTWAVKSWLPAEDPALRMTMSAVAMALAMAARMASGSSGTTGRVAASPPASVIMAEKISELNSGSTRPARRSSSRASTSGTISDPLGMMETRGRRNTGTSSAPPAASAPRS